MSRKKDKSQQSRRDRRAEGARRHSSHQARVNLIVPDHPALRPSKGNTSSVIEAQTDMDVASQVFFKTLRMLGYMGSTEMAAGAVASVCNTLTTELRKKIVQHMLLGLNLFTDTEEGIVCSRCGEKKDAFVAETTHIGKRADRETFEPCEGRITKSYTLKVTMRPVFERLVSEEEEARAKQKKTELWTPGQ